MRRLLYAALLSAWSLSACGSDGATPSPVPAPTPAPTPAPAPPGDVRLNQLGFLPQSAKWAVLAGGPGAGELDFRLVDAATGSEVWKGRTSAPAPWAPADESARLLDFSAFTGTGLFRLEVPGTATSLNFSIGPGVYAPLREAALKAYYFNRASMALTGPLAGNWARPEGHPDTRVLVHASAVGPRRQAGDVISAPKGWYDAGDYNKYVVNSGISTYTLLAAWEHFPAQFANQQTGTPESGNGLPDVLNEALWNLEWMLAMQDPDDGGVYHKLTGLRFDGTVMPHESTADRYVVQKSTAAALNFAATMAQASRVYAAFEAQKPGLSARMLAAARLAWTWAQNHPNRSYQQPADVQTGEYGDSQLRDEFAWAAAELYISTREDAFWAAMQAQQVPNLVPSWLEVGALAWTSLAHHRHQLTAAADQALIEQRVRGLADALAAQWQASGYRVSMQRGDFVWGSNSTALNQGMMLIQGYRLGQQPQHLAAAQAALDYVLGRNALGQSMVTGFGERSPRHPHHRPSEADKVVAPVPGFVVGGPNPGRQDARDCPVPYPATQDAKAYLDHYCSYASNEVAINWNAPLVYLSAALQALTR